jgi:hypothetical protein
MKRTVGCCCLAILLLSGGMALAQVKADRPEEVYVPQPESIYPVAATQVVEPAPATDGLRDVCSGDIILGTGTSNTYQYPINGYYNYSRSISLIKRSEFTTCSPGTIQQLAVQIYTASTMNVTNMQIWMKKTTATTAPTTWDVTGATSVYGPITVNFTPTGWKVFDITDFVWNADNLLIYWQWNGTYSSSRPYFYYTAQSFNYPQAYGQSDTAFPTSLSTTVNRPNYTFTFGPLPAVGACCTGYTCTGDMSAADCATAGGTYMGDGSSCAPNPCQAACCYNYPTVQCADNSQTECAALGGTWHLGQACGTYACPPANDDCGSVTPVALTPGTPLTFTGDNTGATNDCAGFAGGQVWHAFILPATYAYYDVKIDYCGTSPLFYDCWLNLTTACPCGTFTAAGTWDTTTCADGNTTVRWAGLAAGTYYYPVMLDLDPNHPAQGPYTLHVDAIPGYCAAAATSTADETLKNVTVGTINNTTTTCDKYDDFTAISTNLQASRPYPLSLTIGDCEGTSCYNKRAAIYIDYNADGDFADAGETVYASGQLTNTPCPDMTVTGSFTVPVDAPLGCTRMRVVVMETSDPNYPKPCGTFTWGAVEDYTVCIIPPPPEGACCNGFDCIGPIPQEDCLGHEGYVYLGDGTECTPNPCRGACCFADGSCDDAHNAISCAAAGGTFGGAGSLCTPTNPCPQPGACCHTDGTCTYGFATECAALGGIFKGDLVTCEQAGCTPMCAHTICLEDSYGDGWNGGHVTVTVNGTIVVNNATLSSGYGPLCFTFYASTGDTIVADYTAGSYPYENYYEIADINGTVLCSHWGDDVPPDCQVTANCLPPSPGACCLADGTCQEVFQLDCTALGGTFQGQNTTCAATQCPQPGACCLGDGTCTMSTVIAPGNCATGSVYLGNNTTCLTANCPLPGADTCDIAELVTMPATLLRQNLIATDDVMPVCNTYTNPPYHTVWFKVVGTGNSITVDTCSANTAIDTKLQVFCDCPAVTCVGGDDDSCTDPTLASLLTFCSELGHTYYITVGAYSATVTGVFELHVTDGAPCTTPACPNPTGACCFLDGTCQSIKELACTAQGGTSWTEGVGCDPNPCVLPEAACCFADGYCRPLTNVACLAAEGIYQGIGTTCEPNLCPMPPGACCFASGSCQEITAAECDTLGGVYQGDFTTCAMGLCQPVTGACCLATGCQVMTQADCTAAGGSYKGDGTTCTPNPCACVGDLNCDGHISFGDINPFVQYLSANASWVTTYPTCNPLNGDINGDGTYGQGSFGDINPFVSLIVQCASQPGGFCVCP